MEIFEILRVFGGFAVVFVGMYIGYSMIRDSKLKKKEKTEEEIKNERPPFKWR